MKKLFAFLFMVFTINASAQNVNWSAPNSLSSTIGFASPKVSVSSTTPIVTCGNTLDGTYYIMRYVAAAFTTPLQIIPTGFIPSITTSNAPKIAAQNDTVYVTYLDELESEVYLQRSFDGGLTFSDTIRVGEMNGNIPQYTSVGIMNDGNPILAFASLTSIFTDPQYVITKSYDAGNTFTPFNNATASLGADPCDCCAGSITVKDNKVAVIYRNSIADLRDMISILSTDTGHTFPSLGMIDQNGWVIAACPISGGQGLILGDTLVSCFMNGISGTSTFISTLNVNTAQLGFERKLFAPAGAGSQDLSTIAGSGDTIGIAWTQVINNKKSILFSYSTTGASSLGLIVDTLTASLPLANYSNPNLAFANGHFYLVFNENVSQLAYFMDGNFIAPQGIQELFSNGISISSANYNTLTISSKLLYNHEVLISIYDANGKIVSSQHLNNLQTNQVINFNKNITAGVYVVSISSNEINVTKKLILN